MISPGSGAKAPAFSVVIHEKGGGERREQFVSSEISVGRVHGNDIVLPKGNVSKRHARIVLKDGRSTVVDEETVHAEARASAARLMARLGLHPSRRWRWID